MELTVRDVPSMFSEMMILMSMSGQPECSRNGEVLTIQEPLTVTVKNPLNRVLIDPVRQANPYFHVMEFIWMMAGNNQPNWIKAFNSRFEEYADNLNSKGVDIIHGAYGHRWRNHFNLDQIHAAVDMLEYNPESRRVVLSMWDTNADLGKAHNDLPCNTHIYLRVVGGKLNMTVCNRSNDVVWGMTGANAVHMTMLHELISLAAHIPIGKYIVVSRDNALGCATKQVASPSAKNERCTQPRIRSRRNEAKSTTPPALQGSLHSLGRVEPGSE